MNKKNKGNALKELGDIHAAVQSYLKAIKYKPRFSDAYNNLASAYAQLGDTKQVWFLDINCQNIHNYVNRQLILMKWRCY